MEASINERIGQLINHLKLNHKTFAESIGKAPTVIYNTVKGRNKPSFDVLEAICDVYPQVNPAWLLKGEGDVFQKKSSLIDQAPDSYLQEHIRHLEDNFSKLANQLEKKDEQIQKKDEQIEKKDEQIEHLHEMLKMALGKSEGVSIEPVCESDSKDSKGAKTPFFMPFKHKFGYTPSALMVAGSF